MKKILLVGKLNKTVQELYESLSRRFQVQISSESDENVRGMMQIVRPDMVLVSVMELEDVEESVFDFLVETCKNTPILVVGTREGCNKYQIYHERNQITQLIRPISKETLLHTCYQIMNIKETAAESERWAREEAGGMKHILVVDDSSVTLRSIKAMLDKIYQISVATSGEQALRTIRKERPDLILLDYEMPGCDGRETLEKIRKDEEICDIPVIFLTGVADKEHISAVLRLNPAGYFLKPPEKEKLLEAIADVFKTKKEEEEVLWDTDLKL